MAKWILFFAALAPATLSLADEPWNVWSQSSRVSFSGCENGQCGIVQHQPTPIANTVRATGHVVHVGLHTVAQVAAVPVRIVAAPIRYVTHRPQVTTVQVRQQVYVKHGRGLFPLFRGRCGR